MWNNIECSLLSATTNRVQNTSFSACEICRRKEALMSFVWMRLRCIWVWVFSESLCATVVISLFYSETFFLSPSVDVGKLSNHVNSWVLCVCLLFILFLLLLVWIPGVLFAQQNVMGRSHMLVAKINYCHYRSLSPLLGICKLQTSSQQL